MAKEYPIVDSVESFEAALARVRAAQKVYATYTQEQVDKIFKAAALAANNMRIPLAKMAVEETGMGVVEDKVIKNHYAAEYIYNAYKDTQTVGVLERDEAFGMMKVAEPIGVVAAVIPTTNPTSASSSLPIRARRSPPSPPRRLCWKPLWLPARPKTSSRGSMFPRWS